MFPDSLAGNFIKLNILIFLSFINCDREFMATCLITNFIKNSKLYVNAYKTFFYFNLYVNSYLFGFKFAIKRATYGIFFIFVTYNSYLND